MNVNVILPTIRPWLALVSLETLISKTTRTDRVTVTSGYDIEDPHDVRRIFDTYFAGRGRGVTLRHVCLPLPHNNGLACNKMLIPDAVNMAWNDDCCMITPGWDHYVAAVPDGKVGSLNELFFPHDCYGFWVATPGWIKRQGGVWPDTACNRWGMDRWLCDEVHRLDCVHLVPVQMIHGRLGDELHRSQ